MMADTVESFDWRGQTVYAQYANSPVLLALLDAMSQWLDPAALINFFYDNVWNIATATGWGLDVWGRIVGVNRVVRAAPTKYFGFEEAGTFSADPFDQSPFYSGDNSIQNFALSDSAFRQLILAKAAANIWDGSVPGLNAILRLLFPGEVCYVVLAGTLEIEYHFLFTLSPLQQTIAIDSGVLPQPAGVTVTYVEGP